MAAVNAETAVSLRSGVVDAGVSVLPTGLPATGRAPARVPRLSLSRRPRLHGAVAVATS